MKFYIKDVRLILKQLGFTKSPFPIKQIKEGMNIELEHGTINKFTNVTNDDPILTLKIALAHLIEDPEYYIKLKKLNL